MFKIDEAEKITTHIGTLYLSRIDPQKYTITVEPIANHINFKTTGKILGYRDLVQMNAPLWKTLMHNKLGRLP